MIRLQAKVKNFDVTSSKPSCPTTISDKIGSQFSQLTDEKSMSEKCNDLKDATLSICTEIFGLKKNLNQD